jgi:hypothetical protein
VKPMTEAAVECFEPGGKCHYSCTEILTVSKLLESISSADKVGSIPTRLRTETRQPLHSVGCLCFSMLDLERLFGGPWRTLLVWYPKV